MAKSKPGKSKPAPPIPCSGEASTEILCPLEQSSSLLATRPRTERIEPTGGLSHFRTAERYSLVDPTQIIQRIKSEPAILPTDRFGRHRCNVCALVGSDSRHRASASPALSRAAFDRDPESRFERDLANTQ